MNFRRNDPSRTFWSFFLGQYATGSTWLYIWIWPADRMNETLNEHISVLQLIQESVYHPEEEHETVLPEHLKLTEADLMCHVTDQFSILIYILCINGIKG